MSDASKSPEPIMETTLLNTGTYDRSESANRLQANKRIGDYEILDEVARGGMGVVYRARQLTLDRIVALKMIRQQQFASEAEKRRFQMEAEAAATLEHPNIVPIYDIGQVEEQPYFTMRLMEGGSLADRLASPEWDHTSKDAIRQSVAWIRTVAMAVHQAHQRGIIHRDLKPANILLDSADVAYVADFGLAKRIAADGQTKTGTILGTPEYMPPEQALGQPATVLSDVYSLGAILYRMLAGRPPFQAENPADLFKLLVDTPASSLRSFSKIDRDLDTICQKCLEKQPAQRYESALALAQDLERWESDLPIKARRTSAFARAFRWSRRNPLNVLVSALSLLMLAVVSGLLYFGYKSSQQAADRLQEEIYVSRIEQANHRIQQGQLIEAGDSLLQLSSFRSDQKEPAWELNYLRRKLPWEVVTIHGKTIHGSKHDSNFAELHWSPNGQRLAINLDSNSITRSINFCELNYNSEEVGRLEYSHEHSISQPSFLRDTALVWDPSCRYVAQWLGKTKVHVWDVEQKRLECEIPVPSEHNWEHECYLDWSRNGKRLAMVNPDGEAQLFDLESQTLSQVELALKPDESVTGVFWINDDTQLCFLGSTGSMFVDASSGLGVTTWPIHILALSPDRRRWMSRTAIGDIVSASPRIELAYDWRGSALASWSPDGRVICCVDRWIPSENQTGQLPSLSMKELRWTVGFVDSHTGQTLASPKIVNREKNPYANGLISFDSKRPRWFPDSDQVQVGNAVLSNINWQGENRSISLDKKLELLRASPDGERAAIVAESSPTIEVIDPTGKRLTFFAGHECPVRAIDWRVGDDKLASIDTGGKVCVWNASTGAEDHRFQMMGEKNEGKLPEEHAQVWWSPDGTRLAASFSGNTKVWKINDLQSNFEFSRTDSYAIGWLPSPDRLNIQIVGFGWYSSREITQPMETQWRSILTWDADGGSTSCCSEPFDYLLDLSIKSSPPIDQGLHRFELSAFGTISLVNYKERKVILDLIHNMSQNCLMSYSAGQLWVADGMQITIFDGRYFNPDKFGLAAALQKKVPIPEFPERVAIFLGLLMCLTFPGWMILDRSIRLSLSGRWLIGILGAAVCLLILPRVPTMGEMFMPDGGHFPITVADSASILFAVSVCISGYFAQMVALATHRRLVSAYLMALATFFLGISIFVASIWPRELIEFQEKRSLLGALDITGVPMILFFSIHAILGMIVIIVRSSKLNRSQGKPTVKSPLGFHRFLGWAWSMRSLAVSSAFCFLYGTQMVYLAAWKSSPAAPDWIKLTQIFCGVVAVALSLYHLFAIIWILRNGGWDRIFQQPTVAKDTSGEESTI